jgi:PAS domain S-box-containing protein
LGTTRPIETRRIVSLLFIMATVGLIMSVVSVGILYETAFEQTRQRLVETARSRARLMEAMARFNTQHLPDYPGGPRAATLTQIKDAHTHFQGFGTTGEFTLARREGSQIVFVLSHRHRQLDRPSPVPLILESGSVVLAEPMRRALMGTSGTVVGPDYRGVTVLAAYEPVAILNLGIVAKIDMAEIRVPFIRAGGIIFSIGLLVFGVGTMLFIKVGHPIRRQLVETAALKESQRELSKIRDALREKAVYLDSILRASLDLAIIATDSALLIKYSNQAAERLFSFPAGEAMGRPLSNILLTNGMTPERFEHNVQQVRNQEAFIDIIEQPPERGGRIIESRFSGISTTETEIAGFVLMARDITKAIVEQECLARSEKKYRLLIESANDAILIADTETGRILDANPMAGQLLGRPLTEIIGLHQSALHPAEELERYHSLFLECVESGHSLISGVSVVRKDGTVVPVEIRAGVTDLDDQKVIQGIFRDVTERNTLEAQLRSLNQNLEKRIEERTRELERSNQDLQQFAYVASHDLQEPLRLITGYVQLLEKRYRGQLDEKADRYIAYAVDSAQHMQTLINNLLTYSRVGTQAGKVVSVDMDQALNRALINLDPRIQESGATVIREHPLPMLGANPVQMVQLFQNLVGNALKFHGEEPPKIYVSAHQEDKAWIFSVRDNGIGIHANHMKRIFLIFQKLHSRSRYEGTGIGLALCQRIVERHGGHIWVTSEPGQGSDFRFSIPNTNENG